MKFKKPEQEKLIKLNCSTLLCLAINAPSSYEDLRLHSEVIDSAQLLDCSVENVFATNKTLQITFYVHNLGFSIQAVIFSPRPYMRHQFIQGSRDYYYAKVEFNMGKAQVAHPKKVTKIGAITAKYKPSLRSDVMSRFMASMITKENLMSEGLNESITTALMKLHFPTDTLPYAEAKTFNHETLEALKYTEVYDYMQQLSHKRSFFDAKYSCSNDYKEWAKTLPFQLTNEQVAAIEDIKKDLSSNVAAKRMIVGDVGCGKTMVILASVVMAKGYRSILMAPTTLLANQLFEEATKCLPDLKVALVNSKTSKKLDLNEFDFIIGTHALLYRDLPDSALVMVDEQHRFGTQQRNLLAKLVESSEKRVHFLQFSATPIPRTQAMIDSAQIDVSLITTTPFEKDITTSIIHRDDFTQLLDHIKSEIAKQHQVLLVYPLVEQSDAIAYQSIDEAQEFWKKNFNNVYVTHGKDKNKEEVLEEFEKKGDLLIATTVVEVGISLPRLTTVVIVGAERLGLSTLHQLRGRVSRNGLKGYCYLFTNQEKSSRLDEFSKCENGFDIASLDLKYRQSGDLLSGKAQSGKKFVWVNMGEDEKIVKQVKNDLLTNI
ncbi:MAG: ATP-dependent DNA helicase RecG [Helicobacteraceae bacterium]|nr:ATP-dependent DNA helicase RecG [Helicobacteraceae bacterium]